MFNYVSKQAKTDEKMRKIFSERRFLLSGSDKSLRLKKRPKECYRIASFSEIQKEIAIVMNTPQEETVKILKPSPVFRSKPRESMTAKNNSPPVGLYNINYESIDKKLSVPRMVNVQAKNVRRSSKDLCERAIKFSPRRKFEKTRGLSFDKQVPRFNLNADKSDHFQFFNKQMPRHVSSPHFSKQVPRPDYTKMDLHPQYHPDKEKLMRKLSINLDFAKMNGRLPKPRGKGKRINSFEITLDIKKWIPTLARYNF